jgi:cyclophilin family peptidyl-prolyl cis-trans isomerase
MKLNSKKIFVLIIAMCFLFGIFVLLFLRQPIKNNLQNNKIMDKKIVNSIRKDDTLAQSLKKETDLNLTLPQETRFSNVASDDEINILTKKNMSHIITIKTNMGEIRFVTYDKDAPKTVNNFLILARKGFYNGTIFHRVIDGFMIQGGDPEGTGMGGPEYVFEDELNPETDSYKEGYKKGVVAMANAGPNTNGSQFFIMTANYPLPNNYTIFGKVISGQEIVDTIAKSKTESNDRPISPIIMEKVTASEFK